MQKYNRIPSIVSALLGGVTTILTLALHGPMWLATAFAIFFLVVAIVTQPASAGNSSSLRDECEQWRATQKID